MVPFGEHRSINSEPYRRVTSITDGVLVASDGEDGDLFGRQLDLLGNRALIYGGGNVYTFFFDGSAWTQTGVLEDNGDRLDAPFAMSSGLGDLVAARRTRGDYIYLMQADGSRYLYVSEFRSNDYDSDDEFGKSIGMYEFGTDVLVGAPFDDDAGAGSGSAYIFGFSNDSGQWVQQHKLVPDAPNGTRAFGADVALGNGVAVIAAAANGSNDFDASAAFIFVESEGAWTQTQILQPETGIDFASCFNEGGCLGISGSTLVIGADGRSDGDATRVGAVFVYERSSSTGLFELDQILTPSDGEANDRFGRRVQIDGDMIVVGAPFEDEGGGSAGAAYVFQRSGDDWVETHKLVLDDAADGDQFGDSVALHDEKVLIGAPRDGVGSNPEQGSARYFSGLEPPSPAALVLSVSAVEFGEVGVGDTASRGFEVTNSGGGMIQVDISFEGDGAFSVPSGIGQHTLGGGESFALTVNYAPSGAGSDEATITISHDASNEESPVVVALSGTGTTEATASISTSVDRLDFESVGIGEMASQDVSLTNGGAANLIGSVRLESGFTGFSIVSGGGDFDLSPSAELTVRVQFSPDSEGGFNDALRIVHNGSNESSPLVLDVSGSGSAATAAEGTPSELTVSANFPNPFSASTWIEVDLPSPATVALDVFDVLGRRVYQITEQEMGTGFGQRLEIRSSGMPSGVYPLPPRRPDGRRGPDVYGYGGRLAVAFSFLIAYSGFSASSRVQNPWDESRGLSPTTV